MRCAIRTLYCRTIIRFVLYLCVARTRSHPHSYGCVTFEYTSARYFIRARRMATINAGARTQIDVCNGEHIDTSEFCVSLRIVSIVSNVTRNRYRNNE